MDAVHMNPAGSHLMNFDARIQNDVDDQNLFNNLSVKVELRSWVKWVKLLGKKFILCALTMDFLPNFYNFYT